MKALRVARLNLSNVGPFENLDLNFPIEAGISLICGENGIGKTTILESIAAAFARGGRQRLRKRAGSDIGYADYDLIVDGNIEHARAKIETFYPDEQVWFQVRTPLAASVINIRISRDILYARRDSIARDPSLDPDKIAERVGIGLDSSEIKHWFSNRFLMQPHADAGQWTRAMRENLSHAINFFSLLDPSVKLATVDVRTFDILMDTPSGRIPFEYMSSGFKSAFILLVGIVKEIEFRGLDVSCRDFSGVILIDELELHLHPDWQRKIAQALLQSFPCAQIIATTHSPHIIQVAKASEVIALNRSDSGVFVRDLPSSKFGFLGWSLDEVLEDVMGLKETKSSIYVEEVEKFDRAIDSEDAERVRGALCNLREMLHPSSPLRKLFELQAAPVIGGRG